MCVCSLREGEHASRTQNTSLHCSFCCRIESTDRRAGDVGGKTRSTENFDDVIANIQSRMAAADDLLLSCLGVGDTYCCCKSSYVVTVIVV